LKTATAKPVPPTFERHRPDAAKGARYRGCLVGGAVGDALGAPVEFMSRLAIVRQFGPVGIQAFAPAFGRLGAITDDTQMALFTAEGVLRSHVRQQVKGICNPAGVMARAYLRWLYTQGEHHEKQEGFLDGWLIGHRELHSRRAPGTTCLSALRSLQTPGEPADNDSKGCGGVMRVAPVGMLMATLAEPDSGDLIGTAFDVGCQAAAITHGHPTGKLASGTLAAVLMRVLQGAGLRPAIAEAAAVLRGHANHKETLTAIEAACQLADQRPADAEAIKNLGEGWVAEEALAIGLYCAVSASDFRSGVVLAVNHDGDSDSTGSIAGQLLGALHGESAIPEAWRSALELRSVIEEVADDLATADRWRLDEAGCDAEGVYYFDKYPGA
jgi:ADP-ribosyl-[dinitrogen reductase] hydrolase